MKKAEEKPDLFEDQILEINRQGQSEKNMIAGNMVRHETGAIRSADADHARFDLISPFITKGIAATLHEGGLKYGPHNWRKGFKFSECINHLIQHINLYNAGDTSEDHLAHAACNIMFLMEFEHTHPELDDRYKLPEFSR